MKWAAIGFVVGITVLFVFAGATYPNKDVRPLLDILKDWQPSFAAIGIVVAAVFAYLAATAKVKSDEREKGREREATYAKQLARFRMSCWRIQKEVEPIIKILALPQGRSEFDFVTKAVSKAMQTHQGLADLHLDLAHLLPIEMQVDAANLSVHYQAVRDSMNIFTEDLKRHTFIEDMYFDNLNKNLAETARLSVLVQKSCEDAQIRLRASH